MNKKAKAKLIASILNDYYPHPAIPLLHTDAYTLLIAVALSAQCTDQRVNLVTPSLFAAASTPHAMSKLPLKQIEGIIRPCGLSAKKAVFIQKMSQIIVEKHQGLVPNNWEALEALPGVGHKTASVIMAQAFHQPAFPVDTHIHRCAKRWGLTKGKNVVETERDLKALFPRKDWIKLHLQIIYFAREFCKAVKHNANVCPICSLVSQGP